jgi:hypothetical protein
MELDRLDEDVVVNFWVNQPKHQCNNGFNLLITIGTLQSFSKVKFEAISEITTKDPQVISFVVQKNSLRFEVKREGDFCCRITHPAGYIRIKVWSDGNTSWFVVPVNGCNHTNENPTMRYCIQCLHFCASFETNR